MENTITAEERYREKEKFLSRKLEDPIKDGKQEDENGQTTSLSTSENMLLVEPAHEINLQVCDKLCVIPKQKIDKHNIGIEVDVTTKLKAKGLTVKKVNVERYGDPIRGEYSRSEAFYRTSRSEKNLRREF